MEWKKVSHTNRSMKTTRWWGWESDGGSCSHRHTGGWMHRRKGRGWHIDKWEAAPVRMAISVERSPFKLFPCQKLWTKLWIKGLSSKSINSHQLTWDPSDIDLADDHKSVQAVLFPLHIFVLLLRLPLFSDIPPCSQAYLSCSSSMLPVFVGNVNACIRFSSTLLASCVSLSFWNANQQPYGLNSATVHYSITMQTAEAVFTTATAFYVCDGLE